MSRPKTTFQMHRPFPSLVYQSPLIRKLKGKNLEKRARDLNQQLLREALILSTDDKAGQVWSHENYRRGFTSYGSQDRLFEQSPTFEELSGILSLHVDDYCRALQWDCRASDLEIVSLWVNIMPKGTYHAMHLHPHSVVSGTYYAQIPKGASPLKLEDPRLSQFMNRPSPAKAANSEMKTHYYLKPNVGDVILFESWMQHEVPENLTAHERVSISFNYNWKGSSRC